MPYHRVGDHISDREKSRPWMESAADLVMDTTRLPVADVADRIAAAAEKRFAEAGQARVAGPGGRR